MEVVGRRLQTHRVDGYISRVAGARTRIAPSGLAARLAGARAPPAPIEPRGAPAGGLPDTIKQPSRVLTLLDRGANKPYAFVLQLNAFDRCITAFEITISLYWIFLPFFIKNPNYTRFRLFV